LVETRNAARDRLLGVDLFVGCHVDSSFHPDPPVSAVVIESDDGGADAGDALDGGGVVAARCPADRPRKMSSERGLLGQVGLVVDEQRHRPR
jgi:hypothetical protein